jgi:hypothetical protein
MNRIMVIVSLMFLIPVLAQASTVIDTTPKILKSCSASKTVDDIQDLCIVYTKGFIEGAKRIDDIFVTHVVNERKVRSDYLKRVYQTRIGETQEKYELVEKAPFCLTGTENITEMAIKIITSELDNNSLASINDSIYKYMAKNFACSD